jgi:hypothetical protein
MKGTRSTLKTRTLSLPVFLLFCTGLAFAGWRQPTAEENAFHDNTLRTIAAALPTCPAGWRLTVKSDMRPLEKVAVGTEKAPFPLVYAFNCVQFEKSNAGEARTLKAMGNYTLAHKEDSQADALNKERQRLAQEIGKAAGRNDLAAMERFTKELDAVDARLNAVDDAHSRELDRLRAANEAHDSELYIKVEVNTFYQAFDKMSPAAPVAGVPVYRIPGHHLENEGWAEEMNYVFLGKGLRMVALSNTSVLKRAAAPKPPYPSAQLIQVTVTADPPTSRQILESINWQSLQALIR